MKKHSQLKFLQHLPITLYAEPQLVVGEPLVLDEAAFLGTKPGAAGSEVPDHEKVKHAFELLQDVGVFVKHFDMSHEPQELLSLNLSLVVPSMKIAHAIHVAAHHKAF